MFIQDLHRIYASDSTHTESRCAQEFNSVVVSVRAGAGIADLHSHRLAKSQEYEKRRKNQIDFVFVRDREKVVHVLKRNFKQTYPDIQTGRNTKTVWVKAHIGLQRNKIESRMN